MTGPRDLVRPFGEAAFLVELGERVEVRLARRARALARLVRDARMDDPRWGEPIPAAASVLVPFDALPLPEDEARDALTRLVAAVPDDPPPEPGAREVTIPVRYGGPQGPDLDDAANLTGLTSDEIVAAHVGAEHEVLFLGFAPGFPYVAGLPEVLRVPRLATPRVRVEAGSVGIAGGLTGIYPRPSPGGWRIIGRTEVRLFDPPAAEPALLRPGDKVRFVAR
jgi:KipI family sensor histidine kinase inhibitor